MKNYKQNNNSIRALLYIYIKKIQDTVLSIFLESIICACADLSISCLLFQIPNGFNTYYVLYVGHILIIYLFSQIWLFSILHNVLHLQYVYNVYIVLIYAQVSTLLIFMFKYSIFK